VLVDGDGARLQQVVANLLSNAARYSAPASRVDLTLGTDGDFAVLSVRDWGSGIDHALLPRIFEMFVQADQPARHSHGGLGIGLALVHRIVELHDGSVEAHSEGLGRGSEFVVRIPAARQHVDQVSQPPVGARESCRIVLVEDQEDARDMMRALLELKGHSVIEAADARHAIEAIRRERPDVAVVDIGLPDVDGYDVARTVRQSHGCENVLLIALTGYGSQADVRAAEEAGFDAHLTKPAEPERLYRLLASRPARGERRSGEWAGFQS
jgi:CheY-like chemotaxis protein